MHHSRVSVLQGHNKDIKTDQLYQPLRKTFLLDTTAKKSYLEDVSHVSHVSHLSRIHNYNQNHELGERTLIPEDQKLVRINSLSRLPKNHQYYIINAQQRQLSPINQEELDRRLKNAHEEVCMYVYGEDKPEIKVQEKPVVPPRKNPGIKLFTSKYNLFSCIDEPVNNIISGKACSCPANELVASRQTEIYWNTDDVFRNEA